MKSAAEAKDAVRLSEYVNYPELKESLKASFNAKLASEVLKKKDADPFSAMGAAMVTAFINPMIDVFVAPESLAMMMKGDTPQVNKNAATSESSDTDVATSRSYESFDRFVVTATKKGAVDESIDLVFKRDGMFAWKLSGVRFPD